MASVQTLSKPTRARIARLRTKRDDVNDLAAQVASKLTIATKNPTNGQVGKAKRPGTKTIALKAPEDDKSRTISAMRMVNSAMQSLSETIKPQDSALLKTSTRVNSGTSLAVENARTALVELRRINPGTLDYEKAASSIAGKLVRINMVSIVYFLMGDYSTNRKYIL